MRKTPIPDVPVFADSSPRLNPAARYAYKIAVWSIMPVAGAVLGLLAAGLGVVALVRYFADPKVQGVPQGVVAIILGTLAAASNITGLYLIAREFGLL